MYKNSRCLSTKLLFNYLKVKTIDCYQIGRHVQDGGKEEPLGDLGSANLRQDLQNKNIKRLKFVALISKLDNC